MEPSLIPQKSTEAKSSQSKQLLIDGATVLGPSPGSPYITAQPYSKPTFQRKKPALLSLHTRGSAPEEEFKNVLPAVPLKQGKVLKHG